MTRLRALWWRISGSLWFVPSLMVLVATAAAVALVEIQDPFGMDLAKRWPRLFGAGAEGSREVLSAIAGSMITVAGVVFSVTLVALSLAASQYTPRVLRTFMHDRPTQVVLGAFVSVFAYSLVVLRTVRGGDENAFIPALAILGAIVLAFCAIGLLVFFIHHLARSIQVSTIVSRVAAGTLQTIDAIYPDPYTERCDAEERRGRDAGRAGEWTGVPCREPGYIVSVDYEALARFARDRGRRLRMDRAIGDYAIRGLPLASLSGEETLDEPAERELNALYSTDTERTLEQDAAFGIQQIVDIAVRALSPGMNDQSTAILCIDRLAEILVRIMRRRIASPHSGPECPELIAAGPGFEALVGLALDPVRACAGGSRPVLLRLVWALERAAAVAPHAERAAVLRAQAEAVVEAAQRTIGAPAERGEVVTAAQRLADALPEGERAEVRQA